MCVKPGGPIAGAATSGNNLQQQCGTRVGWSDDQRTFLAFAIALAYTYGRKHAAAEDYADMVGCWAEHAQPTRTRQSRIAERVAEMRECAERMNCVLRRPMGYQYNGGAVDWDTGTSLGESAKTR